MEFALLPVDLETGERIELTPNNIKQLGNDELANLTSNLKVMEKLKLCIHIIMEMHQVLY